MCHIMITHSLGEEFIMLYIGRRSAFTMDPNANWLFILMEVVPKESLWSGCNAEALLCARVSGSHSGTKDYQMVLYVCTKQDRLD